MRRTRLGAGHHMSNSESTVAMRAAAGLGGAPGGAGLGAAKLALTAVVWSSAGLFALYILARYIGAIGDGRLSAWNRDLPFLYEAHMPLATTGMGIRFVGGTIILLLGPLQFVQAIRDRAPVVHR